MLGQRLLATSKASIPVTGSYIAVAHENTPSFTLLDHTTPGTVTLATTYSLAGTGNGTAFSPF